MMYQFRCNTYHITQLKSSSCKATDRCHFLRVKSPCVFDMSGQQPWHVSSMSCDSVMSPLPANTTQPTFAAKTITITSPSYGYGTTGVLPYIVATTLLVVVLMLPLLLPPSSCHMSHVTAILVAKYILGESGDKNNISTTPITDILMIVSNTVDTDTRDTASYHDNYSHQQQYKWCKRQLLPYSRALGPPRKNDDMTRDNKLLLTSPFGIWGWWRSAEWVSHWLPSNKLRYCSDTTTGLSNSSSLLLCFIFQQAKILLEETPSAHTTAVIIRMRNYCPTCFTIYAGPFGQMGLSQVAHEKGCLPECEFQSCSHGYLTQSIGWWRPLISMDFAYLVLTILSFSAAVP